MEKPEVWPQHDPKRVYRNCSVDGSGDVISYYALLLHRIMSHCHVASEFSLWTIQNQRRRKKLAHAKWFNESNIETAKLFDERKAHQAAYVEDLARFQETLQDLCDNVPSYRMCPSQTPMHEQVLKVAGKCSNCSNSMCSRDVAATCSTVCGCDWRICLKCMNGCVETRGHSSR